MKYSKWDPNKIHFVNGQPVIYNKADNAISQFQAEQKFKATIATMHTWASRAFRLAAASPNPQLREYNLEHLEWELDKIETWMGAMRQALEEQRGEQRKQETIDKMLALAESTTFPEEADTARRMAEQRKDNNDHM